MLPSLIRRRAHVAIVDMVVDEPHRLHERIDGGRAYEREAAFLQVLRQRDRLVGGLRVREALAGDLLRPAHGGRFVAPEVGGERAELANHFPRAPRVVARRLDLAAMAYDARIGHEALDVAAREARDALVLEVRKRPAKRVALAEDRAPGESRLETLQAELLEETPVIGDRESPFAVVIRGVQRIVGGRPPAA